MWALADADVVGVGSAGQARPPRGAALIDAEALRENRRWQAARERQHRAVATVDRPADTDPCQPLPERFGTEVTASVTAGKQPRTAARARRSARARTSRAAPVSAAGSLTAPRPSVISALPAALIVSWKVVRVTIRVSGRA